MNTINAPIQRREPWNKGKLTGQKAPLRLRNIWAIRIHLQLARKIRILHCLIWRSTASSGPVTWSSYAYAMSVLRITFPLAPLSFNKRRSARLSSKSPRRREMPFPPGSRGLSFNPTPICFQAGFTTRTIFRLVNTHESSVRGSRKPVWMLLPAVRTPCVVLRLD